MRGRRFGAVLVSASLAACSFGDGGSGRGASERDGPTRDARPLCTHREPAVDGGAAEAGTADPLVLWHTLHPAYTGALAELLVEVEDAVGVETEPVRIGGGAAVLMQRWRDAGAEHAPDLVLLPENLTLVAADSGLTRPVAGCFDGSSTALLPAVEQTYTIDGTLWAVPFAVSTPVLLYDRNDLSGAGLDPDRPPRTLDELREACDAIGSARTASVCLLIDVGQGSGGTWLVDQWQAQARELGVVPANGRGDEPAREVRWATDTVTDRLAGIAGMVEDRLAELIGPDPTNQISLQRVTGGGTSDAGGDAAMTLCTSGSLGPLLAASRGGAFPGVDLAVGQLPGPGSGSLVGGSALWVASRDEARASLAGRVATELVAPERHARWTTATGYVPVSEATIDEPGVRDAWSAIPGLRVAYDQLARVEPTAARLGPLVGPEEEIESVLAQATAQVLAGADPEATLRRASRQADALLEAYAGS